MFQTPKRKKTNTIDDSDVNVTPRSTILGAISLNVPDKGVSPSITGENCSMRYTSPGEPRRGRPRAESLNNLILQGSTSPSSIKCTFCNRVFPREKSLQAHLRTHTGEKPYICDFPKCPRQFAQSGQLKTHQRLHTGEKPFICSEQCCNRRFTHANRHCPDHPESQLKRTPPLKAEQNLNEKPMDETKRSEYDTEVKEWLERWISQNKNSTPTKENLETTPKKSMIKREELCASGSSEYFSSNSSLNDENSPKSDDHDCRLGNLEYPSDLDSSTDLTPQRIVVRNTAKFPKKRWLTEAVQEQSKWDANSDLLAHPINWNDDIIIQDTENTTITDISNNTIPDSTNTKDISNYSNRYERVKNITENCTILPKTDDDHVQEEPLPLVKPKNDASDNENKNRPSVLVCVQGGKRKVVSNDEIQGAMALVELKNANFNYRV